MPPRPHASMHPAPPRAFGRARRNGFTLIELTIVLVVMSVAVGLLSSTVTQTARVGPMLQEEALASEAARSQFETLHTVPFSDLYALFNEDDGDDPDGEGTAPGVHFAVAGLTVQPGDADGFVGQFVFPELNGRISESVEFPRLGLPRDLNGDLVVDTADHSDDYAILPVEVVIQWRGRSGDRELRFQTALTELR